MAFLIYNLALLILSPAIAIYVLWRVVCSGKSRNSWREQIGLVKLPKELAGREVVWIHGVSVGESVANAQVVTELKKLLPDVAVVVSTTTQTGMQTARKSVKDADAFIYYPFDLLPFVSSAISRIRPKVFASAETEIWPNFRHVVKRRGIGSAIINGTVSDKTISGARRVPWVYRWALRNIDLFAMQCKADADRIASIGADPARVIVTGNCKADEAAIPITDREIANLRASFKLAPDTRVFVAGSTNPGEDEPVIDAFLAAREQHPSLRMIVAPRQIERRDDICQIAQARGLKCGWRSDPSTITGDEDVILLDTFGELARVYAIADVTFVGGSLIPKGCHSILQPIAQGKPVFVGPYTFKARDLVDQAKAAGVGFQIPDGNALGQELARFLGDPTLLADVRIRCEQMMAANLGASARTAAALAGLYRSRGAER